MFFGFGLFLIVWLYKPSLQHCASFDTSGDPVTSQFRQNGEKMPFFVFIGVAQYEVRNVQNEFTPKFIFSSTMSNIFGCTNRLCNIPRFLTPLAILHVTQFKSLLATKKCHPPYNIDKALVTWPIPKTPKYKNMCVNFKFFVVVPTDAQCCNYMVWENF